MFPTILDGANVLYHTPAGHYGAVRLDTGEIADYITFLAICRYPDRSEYYLFSCNAEYEIVSDFPFEDIPACMTSARLSCQKDIQWIAAKR